VAELNCMQINCLLTSDTAKYLNNETKKKTRNPRQSSKKVIIKNTEECLQLCAILNTNMVVPSRKQKDQHFSMICK